MAFRKETTGQQKFKVVLENVFGTTLKPFEVTYWSAAGYSSPAAFYTSPGRLSAQYNQVHSWILFAYLTLPGENDSHQKAWPGIPGIITSAFCEVTYFSQQFPAVRSWIFFAHFTSHITRKAYSPLLPSPQLKIIIIFSKSHCTAGDSGDSFFVNILQFYSHLFSIQHFPAVRGWIFFAHFTSHITRKAYSPL